MQLAANRFKYNGKEEQAEVESYKAEIASLKEKLKAKNERLDERTDNIIRKANEQAAAILKDAKDFADETIKAMKHGASGCSIPSGLSANFLRLISNLLPHT